MSETITVSGVEGVPLRVRVAGQGPLIILVHGFPELAHSWRHQIAPLVGAGFRVAVPDCRGYGGSGRPADIEAYDMKSMTGDVAAIIDALSPAGPAILIGHDWGAPIVWNTALLHPVRVRAVAGLSIPHLPAGDIHFLDLARALFTAQDRFFYIVYFQTPGVAEAEFEADIEGALRRLYHVWSGEAPEDAFTQAKPASARLFDGVPDPGRLPSFLTPEDFATYVAAFLAGGFAGPLNRYRNFARDHAFMKAALSSAVIAQPSLFIAGERDPALRMFPFDPVQAMRASLSDLRGVHMIAGAGHWVQQEAPQAVSAALLGWLATL